MAEKGKEIEKEVDVLKHELVPEQTILSDAEKKELFLKYDIQPMQLPKILTNDASVKAVGAKLGDVIRIIRKSMTAGVSTYYRIVSKEL